MGTPPNVLLPEEQQGLAEEAQWLSQFLSQPATTISSNGFKHLLRDGDNIMIVLVQGLIITACLIWLIAAEEKVYPLLVFVLFVLPLLAVGMAIILRKSLEITPEVVSYRTLFKKNFLRWTDIEAITIQKTGITFWRGKQYIHVSAALFGISDRSYRILGEKGKNGILQPLNIIKKEIDNGDALSPDRVV